MSELIPIDESRADFFVTGNEYMRDSLDLRFIPRACACKSDNAGNIILADANQDIQQSYLIAKNVFERTKPGVIKFVLIGLSPSQAVDEKVLDDYFKLSVENGTKPVAVVLPVKQSLRQNYNEDFLNAFRNVVNKVVKKHKATFIDLLGFKLSNKLFQDKEHLNAEGKAAVTALLSEMLYFKNIISPMEICGASKDFFNSVSKHFLQERYVRNFLRDDKPLPHHIFCKIACEDFNRLSKTLPKETCLDLMARVFSELTYSHLAKLSRMFPKDDYNAVAARVFKISAEKIRRKDKIKVGFVLYDSSTWCGNDLYNFFAQDEHFEPTVFLCLRMDVYKRNAVIQKELWRQTEQFKSNDVNIVALDNKNATVPEQDLIFYLIPYDKRLPEAFQLTNIAAKTLLAFIPYSIEVGGKYDATFTSIVRVAWKQFFPSQLTLEMYNRKSASGMPQRVYSGYPKLDFFYKNADALKFDWKMIRPDAKKIIWAPHHSITLSIKSATFQWNYKFMYEFAKTHPETSWVVKPHSNLPVKAVGAKIFPSGAAYEEYLKKWDDLPNAKVVTGAYYQAIFTTSDAMIHDCGSFTAEYQYVDKPMIYLTREGTEFNELGNKILKAAYLVDGKDLEAIAAMIQRVIIEGDDYKAAERREIFDKYLNYPKANGMLASEFIYKNICDELKLPPR